jgi:hypothetical protein
LFGLGPKWQEKVVVTLVFETKTGGETEVLAHPRFYERQNDRFDWMETEFNEKYEKITQPLRDEVTLIANQANERTEQRVKQHNVHSL